MHVGSTYACSLRSTGHEYKWTFVRYLLVSVSAGPFCHMARSLVGQVSVLCIETGDLQTLSDAKVN